MAQWIYDMMDIYNVVPSLSGVEFDVISVLTGFFIVMLFVIFVDIIVNGLFSIFKK